jgi:hypothetical protein
MHPTDARSVARATEPALPSLHAFSVRDGRLAPVTCVACGCRLWERADGAWMHYAGEPGRDARGDIVACVADPHYATAIPGLERLADAI